MKNDTVGRECFTSRTVRNREWGIVENGKTIDVPESKIVSIIRSGEGEYCDLELSNGKCYMVSSESPIRIQTTWLQFNLVEMRMIERD